MAVAVSFVKGMEGVDDDDDVQRQSRISSSKGRGVAGLCSRLEVEVGGAL